MSPIILSHAWAPIAGVAAAIACQAVADLPHRYVVTLLEHPEGNGTKTLVPFDLNDAGRITGFAFHGFGLDLTRQPFFWQSGTPHLVPVDWDYTEAHQLASDGTAFGIDDTADTIIHIDTAGTTPVASGAFGPYAEITHVTDTGYVLGNDANDGFVWHQAIGAVRFSALSGGIAPAYAADINNTGMVIGTSDFNDGGSSRAMLWQGQELIDPALTLSGATRGIAIDDQDRVVLAHAPNGFWPGGGVHHIHLAPLGQDGAELGAPTKTILEAFNLKVLANHDGVITGCWNTADDDPQFFMTSPDGLDATELVIPSNMIDIQLDGISDTGMVFGRFHDENYVTFGFVATAEDGVQLLGHRLIGAPPLSFYGVPRDANASGAMIISWAHNFNYSHWALIEPALPGDVDGSGTVDVSDLLDLIAAWGPQPVDPLCGPDLNLDGVVGVDDLLEVLEAFMLNP